MRSRDFCYWLQGFFEISGEKVLTTDRVEIIKNHLNLVFAHEIDPEMGDKDHQEKLNKIHEHNKNNPNMKMRC